MVTQSSLDMLVDGTSVAQNIGYSTASGYVSVSSGSRHVQIEPTGNSSPVVDTTTSLNSGDNVTVLAYLNTLNANSSSFLVDNNAAPSSGNFNLRIINASPLMPTVDVYVEPITSGASGTPLASSLGDGSASGYIGLLPGTWHVIFTAVGSPGSVIFDTGAISSPAAGQVWTVVGLNATSGGLTFAALHDAG